MYAPHPSTRGHPPLHSARSAPWGVLPPSPRTEADPTLVRPDAPTRIDLSKLAPAPEGDAPAGDAPDEDADLTTELPSTSFSRKGDAAERISRNFRQPNVSTAAKAVIFARRLSTALTPRSRSVSDSSTEVLEISAPTNVKHVQHMTRTETRTTDENGALCFSHEGGEGGVGKENQDTFFTLKPAANVAIYGVFDGHGKAHGKLAAAAAATACADYLAKHSDALLSDAAETLRKAFAAAHAAVREAMLRCPRMVDSGSYLLEWMLVDGEWRWDAADGGSTATVAVLLGERLIVAAVGDSSAMLLGRDAEGKSCHKLLLEEHSPTNAPEFDRIRQLPLGAQLRFAYDCPDGELIDIFATDEDGRSKVDRAAEKRADQHDCAVKSARGELMSVIMVPDETVELPAGCELAKGGAATRAGAEPATGTASVEGCAIAMTRSLGDFYAHRCGEVLTASTALLLPRRHPHLASSTPIFLPQVWCERRARSGRAEVEEGVHRAQRCG